MGAGALSAAVVRLLCARQRPKHISITAYEIDTTLIEPLRVTMVECRRHCERAGISFSATVFNEDLIATAMHEVQGYSIQVNTRVAGHDPNTS